jgi:hypothetical protein
MSVGSGPGVATRATLHGWTRPRVIRLNGLTKRYGRRRAGSSSSLKSTATSFVRSGASAIWLRLTRNAAGSVAKRESRAGAIASRDERRRGEG